MAAGASASGTRCDTCGLTGCAAGGAGLGSGRGTELGAACGFAAGSATGRGLCGCGEDAPAPGACRDGAETSVDDFTVADDAAGAFDGSFAVVAAFTIDCADCVFAIGFGDVGDVPAAALDGDDAPAEDGHIATMALFALVIPWPSHDMRPGFCAGAFATTLAAGGFGVVLATGCAGGGGGLTGCAAGGAGLSSGCGAECGAACGFAAGSATGRGLCNCGEDAPAPGACRDGAETSVDDFTVADGTAGAFDGSFAVVAAFTIDCADCVFAIGFGADGGLATDTLGDEGDGAEDGHTAAMALFALVITWP
ncbi:MAG: hypothetical protein LGL72_12895, partial [Acidibrevibacterium sp.]|nr:hypothetical protein [Acidibrevibacterium fodinaquatile]